MKTKKSVKSVKKMPIKLEIKEWRNENRELHREDGPAIEYADGTKWWYLNGQLHREDGPAVESLNGDKYWYLNGKYFSEADFLKATEKKKSQNQLSTIDRKLIKAAKLILSCISK